jgi:hypothetical protein
MLLITVGRYFPQEVGSQQIFCPHERCVRRGAQMKRLRMVGLFFIPIVPVGSALDWRCSNCNGLVVPNEQGQHIRKTLAFNSIGVIGGFLMFAFFMFLALYIGGKGSAFNPESINVARGMLAFFGLCGLLIVAKALYESRRVIRDLSQTAKLDTARLAQIDAALEPGDDIEKIGSKLKANSFTDAEIDTYLKSWVAPQGPV